MYETIIETKARSRWNRVFAANERILDEKEGISKLEFLINKEYDLIGKPQKRTRDQAEKIVEQIRDSLWEEEGLKIIINKNIQETIAFNELYKFELLIMKRHIGG